MEMSIDLNNWVKPLATFILRSKEILWLMPINDKDVLVVDRSLEPQNNKMPFVSLMESLR
jgi:DNA polymerase V